jgi:hypothetical protein
VELSLIEESIGIFILRSDGARSSEQGGFGLLQNLLLLLVDNLEVEERRLGAL